METLFEDARILVQRNSANELFYTNKKSKVTLRIGDYGERIILTADSASWLPTSKHGLPAMEFLRG